MRLAFTRTSRPAKFAEMMVKGAIEMNFKDYQATRIVVKDLGKVVAGFDHDFNQPGFLYDGNEYIMDYGRGVYSVLLGNMEHLTRDLAEAEKVLWANHHVSEHKVMLSGWDLDYFIQGYCALRHYRVDGDVFAVAFHDSDEVRYHPGRAAEIIEAYVKNYDLYREEKI